MQSFALLHSKEWLLLSTVTRLSRVVSSYFLYHILDLYSGRFGEPWAAADLLRFLFHSFCAAKFKRSQPSTVTTFLFAGEGMSLTRLKILPKSCRSPLLMLSSTGMVKTWCSPRSCYKLPPKLLPEEINIAWISISDTIWNVTMPQNSWMNSLLNTLG